MRTLRILFVCVHNSFRSQLAQAIANQRHPSILKAFSAGLDTSRGINPLALAGALRHGYDLSSHHVTDVFELYKAGQTFDIVVAVCSKDAYERCPIFPGVHKRLHWPLDDPSAMQVSEEEKAYLTDKLIHQLEEKIDGLVTQVIEEKQV
ncbi:MAG: arsenate reductase ArsC [Erysipelotrichaceae bacterium]|nr:arsenate reductase ArsC [Erysipelotrichaceae bacterium]